MTLLPIPPPSACPSLFRLAPARDGGISRVKLPLGRLSAAQAEAVAIASARFGNGVIELTSRSNLQIRGIEAGRGEALVETLVAAGLGPSNPLADDIRNVMVSPLAGMDPTAHIDTSQLGMALLARLEEQERHQALSPKFSIQVDGGESLVQTRHPSDIWLAAVSQGEMALGLAGPLPVEPEDAPALGIIPVEQAVAAVTAMLDLFLAHAEGRPQLSRMRHLLAERGTDALMAELEKRLGIRLEPGSARAWRRQGPAPNRHLGWGMQSDGRAYVGARPMLGRLDPRALAQLAMLSRRYGNGWLHLTPWQSLILPGVLPEEVEALRRDVGAMGLATSASEPIATMVACAGAQGCRSGLAETQADALTLAGQLDGRPRGTIHLSGCAKSCALADVAPITLVGVAQGRYDVFARQKGESSRFGRRIAENLAIGEVAALMNDQP